MFFLPIKADFKLPHLPVLTVLVCLVCLGVFLKQQDDRHDFQMAVVKYCNKPQSHIEQMVFERLSALHNEQGCGQLMYELSMSDTVDEDIAELVAGLKPLSGFNPEDSRIYVTQMLEEELQTFRLRVGDDPGEGLAYDTESWNVLHMITSSFAHGDWGHIISNLIGFVAFAVTVEAIIGSGAFILFILINSLIIGFTDSIVSELIDGHHWTLGLSGVVMGVVGLFTYLLPRGKIRCYYWFFVIFGSIAVPAWILALWFIGGDIVRLFTSDTHGPINVLAHVAGGVSGFLYGMLFLRESKMQATALQDDIDGRPMRSVFR